MRNLMLLAVGAVAAAMSFTAPADALPRGEANTSTRSAYCADKLKTCNDSVDSDCKNTPNVGLYKKMCYTQGLLTCARSFGNGSTCNSEELRASTAPLGSARPKVLAH